LRFTKHFLTRDKYLAPFGASPVAHNGCLLFPGFPGRLISKFLEECVEQASLNVKH